MSADLGLIGLAVMGQNLARNMANHGFRVAVYNRTTDVTESFISQFDGAFATGTEADENAPNLLGCKSLEELVGSLSSPRKVMLLIKAGPAVDAVIDQLATLLSPGDVIIDGGNTHYADTERRSKQLAEKNLLYVGTGVSGGEEGALKGPSMMPGGDAQAWPLVQPIFQAIAAKVGPDGKTPCCDWIGPGGSGHYVKMVHNGIEYGDMQLIAEAYFILKESLGLSNEQLAQTFAEWNEGELQSYLIEITRDIFTVQDPAGDGDLIDKIMDRAGAKGTGKWMSQLALDLGTPSTLVTEAVFARALSAIKEERQQAEEVYGGMGTAALADSSAATIEDVRQALYAAKIVSYAQGFAQLKAAAAEHSWELDYGRIAQLWRGGCIIRAVFLDRIKDAYDDDAGLANLLLAPYFRQAIEQGNAAWRRTLNLAVNCGLPTPAFSSALAYFDGYRRGRGSANLIQAQRDYFGAHTYERIDKPRGEFMHTDWPSVIRPVEK